MKRVETFFLQTPPFLQPQQRANFHRVDPPPSSPPLSFQKTPRSELALGPPHSQRIPLTAKPLSTRPKACSLQGNCYITSSINLLTVVFATTTRISTGPTWIEPLSRAPAFRSRSTSSYTKNSHRSILRQSIRSQLQRHPFSGLGNSAGELLHFPEMVPTSMATFLMS